jgi:ornithine cyclodeaminase/alanine dehydrogenase-like protein (mu-crystallin family)
MRPEDEGSEGVYTLALSGYVAKQLGVEKDARQCIGRGFQARAYAEVVAKKLGDPR